jgi:hypothetical protein
MTLIRNRIEANVESDTSAVMTNNEFGPLVNILIEGNYLSGGQYTIYVDDTKRHGSRVSNFLVRSNIIEKGRYGYSTLYGSNVLIDSSNILK